MKIMNGVCKFCGQVAAMEVPDDFTIEQANEEATKKCQCPEAQSWTLREYNRTTATEFIKDTFKGDEYMQDFMTMNLDAVMDEAIEKVTVQQKKWISANIVETKTYTMNLNNESKLIVNVKRSYARKEKF